MNDEESSPAEELADGVRDAEGLHANLEQVMDEVATLWSDQAVWRSFHAMAGDNDRARESFFVSWVEDLYYHRVYMTIRAMRDGDKRSYSLRNLLERVKENAGHIECPVPEMRSPGSTTIDPGAVQADLDALEATAAKVKVFVNKVLAHSDKSKYEVDWIPDPVAVDAAVQLLGDLMRKYALILEGVTGELPTAPVYDWIDIFGGPRPKPG